MTGVNLKYNGISIALTKTAEILSEPILTEDQTDYLYTKYTISVEGIINPVEIAYAIGAGGNPAATPGTIPSETYEAIRHALSQNRQELIYSSFLNASIITSPEDGSFIDVNNGPIAGPLRITRLSGDRTWHVSFVVTTFLKECYNNDLTPILSNRFSQTQDIDVQQKTILTTTGVAYFRTDILDNSSDVADSFRDNLLPPVPFGFQRSRVRFGVNTQGNMIRYDITDEEMMISLGDTGPSGSGTFITKIEGTFNTSTMTDQTSGLPGPFTSQTMNVRLWGSKFASNWVLTQLAFQVMSSKMIFGQPQVANILHFSMTQAIADRFIDVTVSQRVVQNKNAGIFGVINTDGLAVDDILGSGNDFNGVNPGPPNDAGTRGTASMELLSAALKDSCAAYSSPDCVSAGGGVTPVPYCGPAPVVSVFPSYVLPQYPNRYSQANSQGIYTEARTESYYESHHGNYQAPITQTQSSSQSGGVQTSSILNLHIPYTRRVVQWEAERLWSLPMIPSFISSDPNQVLMESTISPAEVTIIEDGITPSYKISGRYVYAFIVDITNLNQISLDIPQWVNANYNSAGTVLNLPSAGSSDGGNFTHGIIDPGNQSYNSNSGLG